jgi:hypothetical protein
MRGTTPADVAAERQLAVVGRLHVLLPRSRGCRGSAGGGVGVHPASWHARHLPALLRGRKALPDPSVIPRSGRRRAGVLRTRAPAAALRAAKHAERRGQAELRLQQLASLQGGDGAPPCREAGRLSQDPRVNRAWGRRATSVLRTHAPAAALRAAKHAERREQTELRLQQRTRKMATGDDDGGDDSGPVRLRGAGPRAAGCARRASVRARAGRVARRRATAMAARAARATYGRLKRDVHVVRRQGRSGRAISARQSIGRRGARATRPGSVRLLPCSHGHGD